MRGEVILKVRNNKMVEILHQATPVYQLVDSPQLLCSGEVLRYQLKPYPKPDRSHRPPLSWSHIGTLGAVHSAERETST
jgi:hypothetical protein